MAAIQNTVDALFALDPDQTDPAADNPDVAAALAAAEAAQDAADAANVALALIANDNVLTRGEKPEVILKWQAITDENADIVSKAAALSVSSAAYTSAAEALAVYLTNIPNGWNNVTTDSAINGAQFRAMFADYYTERQKLINATINKASTVATWGGVSGRPSDAELLNSAIVIGGRNLVIDSSFERGTRTGHDGASFGAGANFAGLSATAGAVHGTKAFLVESTNNTATGKDVYAYIAGAKVPVKAGRQYVISWHYATATTGTIIGSSSYFQQSDSVHVALPLPALDTANAWARASMVWTCPVGVTTIQFRFGIVCNGYAWIAADCLQVEEGNKLTSWNMSPDDFIADIAADRARIDSMSSDSILSRNEKISLRREVNDIDAEYTALPVQASQLGVSSAGFAAAYTALSNYLGTIPYGWSDSNYDSEINRLSFNAAFENYYDAKVALINAMTAKAGTTATWGTVTGPNRPADNATVGAPPGTNVGSTPATTIEARANGALPAQTGFGVTVVGSGTIANSATGTYTLAGSLSASVTGAVGSLTYAWAVTNRDNVNGAFSVTGLGTSSITVTMRGSQNSYSVSVSCTVTDSSTGLSKTGYGDLTFNFGTGF